MKISAYMVIYETDVNSLTEKVNEAISKGWQPFGSITSASTPWSLYLYQPMITYVNNDDKIGGFAHNIGVISG
jgi:hypothetical protein